MMKHRFPLNVCGRSYILCWDSGDMTPETLSVLSKLVNIYAPKYATPVEDASDAMIVKLFHGMNPTMQTNILEIMKLTQVEMK